MSLTYSICVLDLYVKVCCFVFFIPCMLLQWSDCC